MLPPEKRILFHSRFDVASHVVKKNNRPIWRGRIGKSDKLLHAEKIMVYNFVRERMRDPSFQIIDRPVWLMVIFYFKDFYTKPKRKSDTPRMSMTLGDLSNLYQLPEDCLVKAKILTNDAWIVSHDMSRKLPSKTGRDYIDLFVIDYPNEPGRLVSPV